MPRLSTLRCALIATSLFATSASAAELWATTQDSFGNARAIQYDLATGNIAQGVRLDFNLSGADSPISWDRMGSIAFDPEGKLWGTTRDSLGNARAIQYDLATGNIVQGVRLDFNLSGSDSPIAWDRMGSIAFDPEGKLWGTTQDSLGNARAIQYDLATGNIVQGVRLDFNLSGADSPISWDRMGSIAFDPEGKLWGTTQDSFGYARAIQYDLATGNIVQGVRLDFNLSGSDSPIAWDRMGSIAFDPEGKLWGTTQDSLGYARAIQYDLATGNIVQGVRLDFNLSGADSPIAWARMGAIAFRDDPTAAVPEPATWLMMILGFAAVGMTARWRGGRGLTAAQA